MTWQLVRGETGEYGTFGKLWGNQPIGFYNPLYTCEDDWKGNARNTAIAPGQYELRRTIYHKHGYETFEVYGVPGRNRILIHPGNTEEDSDGCILVGMRKGELWVADEDKSDRPLTLKTAVVESRKAFAMFMEAMTGKDRDYLNVLWGPGLPG